VLEDLAHTDDYLSRQLTRWLTQLDSYEGRALPAAHQLSDWLGAHRPDDQPSALCHGDYKLDNVLFAPEDLAIVKGDPSERRRYLDDLLVASRPRNAAVRADYERVRTDLIAGIGGERNAFIRNGLDGSDGPLLRGGIVSNRNGSLRKGPRLGNSGGSDRKHVKHPSASHSLPGAIETNLHGYQCSIAETANSLPLQSFTHETQR